MCDVRVSERERASLSLPHSLRHLVQHVSVCSHIVCSRVLHVPSEKRREIVRSPKAREAVKDAEKEGARVDFIGKSHVYVSVHVPMYDQ